MTPEQELRDLHAKIHIELAKTLLARVTNPESSSADLNVARAFLKDNEIQAAPGTNKGLDLLADFVPRFSPNELNA